MRKMQGRQKKRKFHRQFSQIKRQMRNSWRRPRGVYSRQRRNVRSHGIRPNPGYGNPRSLRNLHPCGMKEVVVYNVPDVGKLDPKLHCVRIGSSVGVRKRIGIAEAAEKRNIRVLNKKALSLKKKVEKKEEPKQAKK